MSVMGGGKRKPPEHYLALRGLSEWWAMLDLNQRPLVCEPNRSVNIYNNLQPCNPTVTPALVR